MKSIWLRSIVNSPCAYLSHRAANFGALLWKSGTPGLCTRAPFAFGIEPAVFVPMLGRDIVPELGLRTGSSRREWVFQDFLLNLPAPLFNHVFWATMLLAAAAALWRRGRAAPLVLLAAGAVVFALGFAVVGIACDFRYLYVLPLAATVLDAHPFAARCDHRHVVAASALYLRVGTRCQALGARVAAFRARQWRGQRRESSAVLGFDRLARLADTGGARGGLGGRGRSQLRHDHAMGVPKGPESGAGRRGR